MILSENLTTIHECKVSLIQLFGILKRTTRADQEFLCGKIPPGSGNNVAAAASLLC
jgi:hypothetical protein